MADPVPLYLAPERLDQLQQLTDAVRLRAALYPPQKPPQRRRCTSLPQRPAEPAVAARALPFRAPLGRAMSYTNAKEMFDRLARALGQACRPHMLRHSAATRWLRDGVDRDVVQRLLGHASPLSMERYRHVNDAEARAAVERVGSLMERP